MDQYSNNSQNEFLWSLLDNPANDAHLYTYNLQRLVNDFPQSGLLQALLAHASDEKNLKQASVYFSPRSLFKLINAPATLVGVPDERIYIQPGIGANGGYQYIERQPLYQETFTEYRGDNIETATEELHIDHNAPVIEPEANTHSETPEHVTAHEPDVHHFEPTENHWEAPVIDEQSIDEDQILGDFESPVEAIHAEFTAHHHIEEATAEFNEATEAETHEGQHPDHITEHFAGEGHETTEVPVHEGEAPWHHQAEEFVAEKAEDLETAAHETEIHTVSHTYEDSLAENKEPVEFVAHEHDPFAHEHQTEEVSPENTEAATHETEHRHPHHVTDEVVGEAHEAVEFVGHEAKLPHEHRIAEESPSEIHEVAEHEAPIAHDITEESSSEILEVAEHEAEAPTALHVAEESPSEIHEIAEHEAESPTAHHVTEETTSEINEAGEHGLNVPETHHHDIEAVDMPHPVETKEEEYTGITAATHISEPVHHALETPAGDEIDETYDEIVGIDDIQFGKHSTSDRYFSFDHEFGAHEDETVQAAAGSQADTENQDVSKYHDEKMPYSFMWWLDKTRKEHAQIYQPYTKPQEPEPAKKTKKITDELTQQYFENIFHITSVEELDKSTPPVQAPYNPYYTKRKEQVIIERFIKEEPQIRPQSSDKLDNENKAKKSSEDRDELVTETLAGIYSDQMLYHKAISSYKKLMLRFPEKSRYFAEKIEQLEKKTN